MPSVASATCASKSACDTMRNGSSSQAAWLTALAVSMLSIQRPKLSKAARVVASFILHQVFSGPPKLGHDTPRDVLNEPWERAWTPPPVSHQSRSERYAPAASYRHTPAIPIYCPPIASSILTIISCCSSDNNLPRSTYRYAPKQSTDRQEQLYQRVIALSWHHPRYGYRRIRALLAREGWQVSRKQVQRVRRREGLKVREKPKKIPRRGISTGLPTQATHRHHVWTWDFIFDRTDNGGTLKMMTLLDEYSRQSLAIQVERQITGAEVLRVVEQTMIQYGVPGYIRSDNGPEFIANTVQQWLNDNRIKTIYIDPGSPWQNGYIESFHSRFRDECLSRELLLNLREAKVVIADWRQHDNEDRPHSRLGYLNPDDYIHTKILTS